MHKVPHFIVDHEQLEDACRRWSRVDAIGLDTEFERTRTYYSRPALVQIFDGQQVSLIDPLSIADFASLRDLLQCSGVTKVMHASEGDIEVLEQLTGTIPHPIFDTQIAAAFAGHGYSLGYRSLSKLLLEVDLAKDETRSDWLRRPLTAAQISYAALDVVHLLPMHAHLQRQLEQLDRHTWLLEETERLRERRGADGDPRRAYMRIRQTRHLTPAELARLRDLAAWRETEARHRDVPRQMVVKDRSLVEIALRGPSNRAQLADIPELSANALERYSRDLLDITAAAQDGAPPPVSNPPMERRYNPQLKALKLFVRQRAECLNIPAPMLAQSRTLEALIMASTAGDSALPEELQGWREAVIGTPLMAELRRIADA